MQTMSYKTLHKRLMIEHHDPTKNQGMNPGDPEVLSSSCCTRDTHGAAANKEATESRVLIG
jgi:hypothetical protein